MKKSNASLGVTEPIVQFGRLPVTKKNGIIVMNEPKTEGTPLFLWI